MFQEKQREAMRKLKNDYASKLNNLKQAKKALQEIDYNKENFPINRLEKSLNMDVTEKQKRNPLTNKQYFSSNYTSEDESIMRHENHSPIKEPKTENPYKHNRNARNYLNIKDQTNNSSISSSTDLWNTKKRQTQNKSVPKYSQSRSRQAACLPLYSSTSSNAYQSKDRQIRTRSFLRDLKHHRPQRDLSPYLLNLRPNHHFSDTQAKASILLSQADALYQKLHEHLGTLALTRQQQDRCATTVAQYRENFRQLKLAFEEGNKGEGELEGLKTDLGAIIRQSLGEVTQWFDEWFTNIEEIGGSNRAMYSFKMKEVSAVFDTLVSGYYKGKVLALMPDLVFTLEATRMAKAGIISQNYLSAKHRLNLKKGLDAFRRNVSRFYIKQDKTIEQEKNKERACNLMHRVNERKQTMKKFMAIAEWKKYCQMVRQVNNEQLHIQDKDQKLTTIEQLHKELERKDRIVRKAHKCYKYISNFANAENEHIDETSYQKIVYDICDVFFSNFKFELRFEDISRTDLSEEELLDFKWRQIDKTVVLNLNKPAPKTHQYRLYFTNMEFEQTAKLDDVVHILKLLINILAWVRTLKTLNDMLLTEEVVPLRQDCKTLTIVNNVRSILEEANSEELDGSINRFIGNPRELQEFLQEICQRVFLALHIETEWSVVLNDFQQDCESESLQSPIAKKMGVDGKLKSPLAERRRVCEDNFGNSELNISYSQEMIVLKSENLVVEAKVLAENVYTEESRELAHTFNPTQQSKVKGIYDDVIPINETTKQFIFKLLKVFIENFYFKIKERQEIFEREEYQDNKIAEYENELRLLKDWNSFILMNMNRENAMDNYENCVMTIEKYLICELAKFIEIEDINIFYTYDYETMIKVRNSQEIVLEEVSDELSDKIKEHLDGDHLNNSDQHLVTKWISIMCDDLQHYFLISSELTIPEKVSFIVKIECKEEQEGVVASNTLQILSNVFLQTLSHFLNEYYKSSCTTTQSQVFQVLMESRMVTHFGGRPLNKEERNHLMYSAERMCEGINTLDKLSRTIPLRMCYSNLKAIAFKSKGIVTLEKLFRILDKRDKKKAFTTWKRSLDLWKKKVSSIKKLLQWNKMKITSRVLNKWYSQYKYEESVMHSVCHRDYIISMYEILGNTQNTKQFSNKYQSVFTFMVNRYIKQWLHPEAKNNLKKVVLVLKREKGTFWMFDLSEAEKSKPANNFISPIKDTKNLPDYMNVLMSNMSSPATSGRITPIHQQIFIEDQEFLNPVSPQNYSFLINSTKYQNKGVFHSKVDLNSDYIVRQCIENPHCSKITNMAIIREALKNRNGDQKNGDQTSASKSINCCIVIPVKVNEDNEFDDDNDTMDIHSFSKQHIGTLELYFNDTSNKVHVSHFEDNKQIQALSPIFNLLKEIVINDAKNDYIKELEETKIIEEAPSQVDESKVSISASFLEANRKTTQDALMCFTQSTKRLSSLSHLLYQISQELPKVLVCQKAVVILIVETPNNNLLGGPTKTAYFYSFSDNHTYNFNYDGTFIETRILETGCPLTFTAPTPCLPSSLHPSLASHYPRSISNEAHHTIRYLPITAISQGNSRIIAILETCYSEVLVQNILHAPNDNSYISEFAEEERIITQLDSCFEHPRGPDTWNSRHNEHTRKRTQGQLDSSDMGNRKRGSQAEPGAGYAGWTKAGENNCSVIEQNTSLLSGFADAWGKSELEERRVHPEHRNLEIQCAKVIGKRLGRHMRNLGVFCKAVMKGVKRQEQHVAKCRFLEWSSGVQKLRDMKIEDFKKELNDKQNVIDELKRQNLMLHEDITEITAQNEYKRNLKGAALAFSAICSRIIKGNKVRTAFDTWRADYEVNRVMENAFNKVLEMNHKHVSVRISSGVSLLGSIVTRHTREAFNDMYLCKKPEVFTRNQSPTPKFNYFQNMLQSEEYSSSLHDSTLFLSSFHNRRKSRKNNKSMDTNSFLF